MNINGSFCAALAPLWNSPSRTLDLIVPVHSTTTHTSGKKNMGVHLAYEYEHQQAGAGRRPQSPLLTVALTNKNFPLSCKNRALIKQSPPLCVLVKPYPRPGKNRALKNKVSPLCTNELKRSLRQGDSPHCSIAAAEASWMRSAHPTSGCLSLIGWRSFSAIDRPALAPWLISGSNRMDPLAPPHLVSQETKSRERKTPLVIACSRSGSSSSVYTGFWPSFDK